MVWNEYPLPPSFYGYNLISMSANAEYIVIAERNGPLLLYSTQSNQIISTSTIVASLSTWNALCMSYDGSIIIGIGNDEVYYNTQSYDITTMSIATIDSSISMFIPSSCAMSSSGDVTVISQYTVETTSSPVIAIYRKSTNSTYKPTFIPLTSVLSSLPPYITNIYFTNIAIDETGNIIAIGDINTGMIYISIDSGNTFINKLTLYDTIQYITLSQYNNGNYILSLDNNNDNLQISYNQGNTWISNTINNTLVYGIYSLSSSYSNQISIITTNIGLYITFDYGMTWELSLPLTSNEVLSGYISSTVDPTGQYFGMVQSTSNTLYLSYRYSTLYPTVTPTLQPSYNPAYIPPTISPTISTFIPFISSGDNLPNNGRDIEYIESDNNGKNLLVINNNDQIYISQDYGFTWELCNLPTTTGIDNNDAIIYWNWITISGNGMQLYALSSNNNTIYTSTITSSSLSIWTSISSINTLLQPMYLNQILCDNIGQYLFISGLFYYNMTHNYYGAFSDNNGLTFTLLTDLIVECNSIGMNKNGSNLICLPYYDDSDSTIITILISTNYGKSFSNKIVSYTGESYVYNNYIKMITNDNNNYIYLPAISSYEYGDYLYITNNNGNNWYKDYIVSTMYNGTLQDIFSMSVTSNGLICYLASLNGLYYTMNGGNDWYIGYIDSAVYSVVVSGNNDNIYIVTDYGLLAYRNNTGLTSTPTTPPTMAPTAMVWQDIQLPNSQYGYNLLAITSDGDYIVASQYNNGIIGYNMTTGAYSYTNTMGTNAICISNHGERIVLISPDSVHYSSNYIQSNMNIATFNMTDRSTYMQYGYSCSMTPSGNVVVISQYYYYEWVVAIYKMPNTTSSTFAPIFTPITNFPQLNSVYSNVQIDSTGEIIVLMSYTSFFISKNGGLIWTSIDESATFLTYSHIVMSQTNHGQYMITTGDYSYQSVNSNDQGLNWTNSNIDLSVTNVFTCKGSMSAESVIVTTNNCVYLSMDSGTTWELVVVYSTWFYSNQIDAAVDPTGRYYGSVEAYSSTLKFATIGTTPSQAPTQPPPTHVPTTKPSFKSTSFPTSKPSESGWMYSEYYTSSSCSVGTPAFVSGRKLNTCFATQGALDWYSYSCSKGVLYTNSFANSACSGQPYASSTINCPSITSDGNTCTLLSCSSSDSLPIPDSTIYSMDQYYDGTSPGVCSNVVRYDGYLNHVCVRIEYDMSIFAVYPWVAVYGTADCTGPILQNTTYLTGCTGAINESWSGSWLTAAVVAPPDSLLFSQAERGRLHTPSEVKLGLAKRFGVNSISEAATKIVPFAASSYDDDGNLDQYSGHSYNRVEIIPSSSSSGLSTAIVAGIIVGVFVGAILLAVLYWYYLRCMVSSINKKQASPAAGIELADVYPSGVVNTPLSSKRIDKTNNA